MGFIAELWLPIALSAVFVFIVSSILHVALPFHRGDYIALPEEERVLQTLREAGAKPGSYMFPRPESMEAIKTPEYQARLKEGPLGVLTIGAPGRFNMGMNLGLWFVQSLITAVLIAYVGWHGLGAGASSAHVFQVTGAAAVLGYAVGHMHESIWKCLSWTITARFIVDGILYALTTAGTFAWLWPAAAPPA